MSRKILLTLLMLALLAFIAACTAEPEIVEVIVTQVVEKVVEVEGETVVVTEVVETQVEVTREVVVVEEAPEETEEEMAGEAAETYTIGIFEDPLTLNYWSYLGPSSSVWTQYALAGTAPSLYTLSDQRFDFVPDLATDLPPEPVEEDDGNYSITVEMRDDATWSDGEPITAHDFVFTLNTCLDLHLTQGWANVCKPDRTIRAEAVDDYTVKIYFNAVPGLAEWQFGVAQAPVLAEHFWGDTVNESRAFIEGLELPEVCGEEAAEEDQAACEAFDNARQTLYAADVTTLSGGSLSVGRFEPGAFVQKSANADYYSNGTEVVEYDDGTYMQIMPDGSEMMLYGEGGGEETLRYTVGSPTQNVILSIYGSQDAAYLALQDGQVDYVLNPLGASPGLVSQATSNPNVTSYVNEDNGVFYLAFNQRKAPFSDPAFREAVDILIDKEFVTGSILQGTVFPAYSMVPPGNAFWHLDYEPPFAGMSREERVEMAKQILTDAGYSWDVEPAWNADREDVDPGEGFTLPDGTQMEEITILGPGPSYDPQRATFNQWISEWMREMGIPVESELTGFNTILGPVFQEASFDMYILGWSLSIYPDYVCDFFDSKNDTATTGNYNTPGFNNEEFDALCEDFLAETDVEQAKQMALQLQEMLLEGRPYINLFHRQARDLAGANVEFPYTEVLGGLPTSAGFQSEAEVRQ